MPVLSNEFFWTELRPRLRALFPHLASEQYKAYETLLRLMQAIMYSADSFKVVETDKNCDQDPRVSGFLADTIAWTTWQHLVSGIEFEVERVQLHGPCLSSYPGINTHCYIVTTENWEAVLRFDTDERVSNEREYDVCHYLQSPVKLHSIDFEGDVDGFYRDMFFVMLTINMVESGEVFYKGSPI